MATASPRQANRTRHDGLQLHVTVSCAKLKRKKNWFGSTVYTELAVDGETKKTAKASSSSNPKWEEQLTVNVTPQTTLEFKVWSHHTLKADALLGKTNVDLKQALEVHNRKLERVKEQLKLSLDGKHGTVHTGELTVILDGLIVEPESLTTCNSTCPTPMEIQQNGDAIHENGESSSEARTGSAADVPNGTANEPASSYTEQNAFNAQIANGDNASSPSHVASRPKNTPAPNPPSEQAGARTVNGTNAASEAHSTPCHEAAGPHISDCADSPSDRTDAPAAVTSESSTSAASTAAEPVRATDSVSSSSAAGSSSPEAAKTRQTSVTASVDPVRQQPGSTAEPLPPGYAHTLRLPSLLMIPEQPAVTSIRAECASRCCHLYVSKQGLAKCISGSVTKCSACYEPQIRAVTLTPALLSFPTVSLGTELYIHLASALFHCLCL